MTAQNMLSAQTVSHFLEMERVQKVSESLFGLETIKLQNILRELTIEKNKKEDRMYRAFTKLLNTKKKRVKQLEKELACARKTECASNRTRAFSNVDDDEMNDYEKNTDLSSDNEKEEGKSKAVTKPDSAFSSPLTEAEIVLSPKKQRRLKTKPSFLAMFSSDSDSDAESQKIIPVAKYKLKSTIDFVSSPGNSFVKENPNLNITMQDTEVPGPSTRIFHNKHEATYLVENNVSTTKPASYDAEDLMDEF